MRSTESNLADAGPRLRIGASLVILRVALGVFLLVWGLEKFIVTSRSIEIYQYF